MRNEHIKYVDSVVAIQKDAKDEVFTEIQKLLKVAFAKSNGKINNLPQIVRAIRTKAVNVAVTKGIGKVRQVQSVGRKFAQEKLNAV